MSNRRRKGKKEEIKEYWKEENGQLQTESQEKIN